MQPLAIKTKKLTVQKGRQAILSDLTFSIRSGSITGLIGPSGSGKTTLMRSLIGVQALSGGTAEILDLSVGSRQLRQKIGYVTQSPAIYMDLTVRQNLRYFGSVLGVKNKAIDDVLEQIDLQSHADQLAGSLSGGQKARVSLGIALLGSPELLILDEPTVGLDPVLREKLWKLFRSLAAGGKTLLVSSHVMDEAERCDRLLFLRDGRLLADDTPAALKGRGNSLEAAFIALSQQHEGGSV